MIGIESRQIEIDRIFARYNSRPPSTVPAVEVELDRKDLTPADESLLDKILRSRHGEKFTKLYKGEWQGNYPSQSEADLSLCSILAFWCQKDQAQIDRIFCKSGLFRPKWDERHGKDNYGNMTIERAISQTEKVYTVAQDASQKKVSNTRKFELVQAGKIEVKPTQWLVRDLMELDSLALLFGDPGCGKSFWAIAIALAIATGTTFYGHKVLQGPVIYIAGEGHNGLKKRILAWSHANGVNHEDAPLFVSTMPAALTDATIVQQVQTSIESVSADHAPPVLIVIDTLARNFGPGDENSTQDMGLFIQAADTLRAISQATVLLVHHSGHGDKSRARGAMALKGALDAEYRLDKDDMGIVRLEATKMKDAKHPEPAAYKILSIILPFLDSDGAAQFSAVLESTSYSPPPQKGKAGQGKHQTRALQILREIQDERRKNHSDEGKDPATARISVEEWKKTMKDEGIPQQRISEVVNSLRNQNMITGRDGFVSPL